MYLKHWANPQAPNVIAMLLKQLQNSAFMQMSAFLYKTMKHHTTSKFGAMNTVTCLKIFTQLYLRHLECVWRITRLATDGSSTYFAFAILARYRTLCLTLLNRTIVFFEDTWRDCILTCIKFKRIFILTQRNLVTTLYANMFISIINWYTTSMPKVVMFLKYCSDCTGKFILTTNASASSCFPL